LVLHHSVEFSDRLRILVSEDHLVERAKVRIQTQMELIVGVGLVQTPVTFNTN